MITQELFKPEHRIYLYLYLLALIIFCNISILTTYLHLLAIAKWTFVYLYQKIPNPIKYSSFIFQSLIIFNLQPLQLAFLSLCIMFMGFLHQPLFGQNRFLNPRVREGQVIIVILQMFVFFSPSFSAPLPFTLSNLESIYHIPNYLSLKGVFSFSSVFLWLGVSGSYYWFIQQRLQPLQTNLHTLDDGEQTSNQQVAEVCSQLFQHSRNKVHLLGIGHYISRYVSYKNQLHHGNYDRQIYSSQ